MAARLELVLGEQVEALHLILVLLAHLEVLEQTEVQVAQIQAVVQEQEIQPILGQLVMVALELSY